MPTIASTKTKSGHHGLRSGPPGDTTEYWMPRDIAIWEEAWAAFHGQTIKAEAYVAPAAKPGASLPVDPVRSALEAEAIAFIRDYTGNFGLILSMRADPRFGSKHFRMTDRMIEVVLASKRRDEEFAARQTPKPAGKPATEQGMYRIVAARGQYAEGSIFKVQIAVHGSQRPYAKLLVVDGPGDGHFDYAPGAVSLLTAEDKMSADEAAEWGRLYGMCVVCSATLTDEDSIARGIGPICRGKV